MKPKEAQRLQTLVYEYYRLWVDHYGPHRQPPTAWADVLDYLEKEYGLLFREDSWRWEQLRKQE